MNDATPLSEQDAFAVAAEIRDPWADVPEVDMFYKPEPHEVLITGNRKFCHESYVNVLKMVKNGDVQGVDIKAIKFCIIESGEGPSDAQRRKFLRSGDIDPGLEASIRKGIRAQKQEERADMRPREYFGDREQLIHRGKPQCPYCGGEEISLSAEAEADPLLCESCGKRFPEPIRSEKVVSLSSPSGFRRDRRPAGMSGRQWRKMRKAAFGMFKVEAKARIEAANASIKPAESI